MKKKLTSYKPFFEKKLWKTVFYSASSLTRKIENSQCKKLEKVTCKQNKPVLVRMYQAGQVCQFFYDGHL